MSLVVRRRDEIIEIYHERWEIEIGYECEAVKTDMLGREETIRSRGLGWYVVGDNLPSAPNLNWDPLGPCQTPHIGSAATAWRAADPM